MTDENAVLYTAVYDDKDAALADLSALERLYDARLLASLDAAVVDKEGTLPHIVRRVERPRSRAVPGLFGHGVLPRDELHAIARNLTEGAACLVVMADPALGRALGDR